MLSKSDLKNDAAGFSFLELLIIVVIIGIVAAIATPQLKHYKQRIYDRDAKANLESLYFACKTYWADDSSAQCSLDIAKETSNGYIQSSYVVVNISSGKETKTTFEATAKHNSSNKTYIIDKNGTIR